MYLGRNGFVGELDSDQIRVFAGRVPLSVWLSPLMAQPWPGTDLSVLDVELTDLNVAFARAELKPNAEVLL